MFAADFETTTDLEDCRVWAWALCEIGNINNFVYGNSITELFDYLNLFEDNVTLYFHNLKFDGEFILNYLFRNGWNFVEKRKELEPGTFTTLISDKNMFYSITICFANKKLNIYDSLKVLPMSIDSVAKAFNLPVSKLTIDYKEKREENHILTQEEIDYIKNDVIILSMALDILHKQNLKKMTTGSNALEDYKKSIGRKNFRYWFPPPKYDADIRQSYKGGYTYLKYGYEGVDLECGIVLDVNSLYPSVMYYNELPFGEGIYFDGKYEKDDLYTLYVQKFSCQFELKDGYLPTIQIKNNLSFVPTKYLVSSNGEVVTLCLTSVDIDLFFEHYYVYDITYYGGWKFQSHSGLFREYIDKWNGIKIKATVEGNGSMRSIAKLMLNSLYGKFATNPIAQSKIPYLGSDGIIHYKLTEPEERKPVYIPMGSFITAWARYKTITSAQKLYDRFVYADTDSLHLIGKELPSELEISPTKLGAWKHESTFKRARFLRQKSYIEEIEGKLKITCAGLPADCHKYVTWENFHIGMVYPGKLRPQHTIGGIVLVDTVHTLRE